MEKIKQVFLIEEADFLEHKIGNESYRILDKKIVFHSKEKNLKGVLLESKSTKEKKVISNELLSNFLMYKYYRLDDYLEDYSKLMLLETLTTEQEKISIEYSNIILDYINVDAGDRKEASIIFFDFDSEGKEQLIFNLNLITLHSSKRYEVLDSESPFELTFDEGKVEINQIFFWKK